MDKSMELLEKMYIEMQEMKQTMATKDDLKNFATKDDLKDLATKEDLNILAEELHHEIQIVQDQVMGLTDNLDVMELLTTKNSYEISKIKLAK